MKTQKITTLLVLLFALFSANLSAQIITFERTDVKGNDAGFVTATKIFSFNIKIEDAENCSNVAFELSHNLAQYVQYDEFQKSEDWRDELGKCGTLKPIYRIDNNNPDRAIITIQAGTGRPADENSPNNPKIIHLAFAVKPEAIHNQVLEFSINNVRATVFKDSIVELDIPTVFRIPYRIHSFVPVWPGDANCDGVVNALDFAAVSLYLHGSIPLGNSRGFKRNPTSILWQPQMCIAWDTLAATYADCDGNGIITTSDMVVVALNLDSVTTHFYSCNNSAFSNSIFIDENIVSNKKNNDEFSGGNNNQNDFEITENTITVPINIDLTENSVIGAAGIIDYSAEPNIEIIGFSAGEFFDDNSLFHYFINPHTNKATFIIMNSDKRTPYGSKNNVVAYIHIKDNSSSTNQNFDKAVTDFIGFDALGNIKNLNQIWTSISLDSSEEIFTVKYNSGNIFIENKNIEIEKIQILNVLGGTVANFSFDGNSIYSIGNLPTGVYFVVASNSKEVFRTKFFVGN